MNAFGLDQASIRRVERLLGGPNKDEWRAGEPLA
jgi:hypothetical protein